jgi:SAM-dependent methyltransferase
VKHARATEWGRRASELYRPEYARAYRAHDDELVNADAYDVFAGWIAAVCRGFEQPIDVLDLGCGTGRYFSVLTNVRSLVGIDVSQAMLDEGRNPVNAPRIAIDRIELVAGDFLTHDFGVAQFDLVYSIGVLAEHSPLDERVVQRAARWLRPGGRFAFSTVHPASASIPRTAGRAIGTALLPWTRGGLRARLRQRLLSNGLYADEERIQDLLTPAFSIESMERRHSEAHLHALCVARKVGA